MSPHAVEIGAFGMSTPGGSDAHMGMAHGWVQYTQLYDNQRTIIVTPLNADSPLESWRPVMEYGGGGWEWATQTKAWAEEWVENKQYGGWQIITAELATFPFLYMSAALNATGLWPKPRSPWPSWHGNETVKVALSGHWNPPTSKVLAPGETVTYGMRISATAGGPRDVDAALVAVGEPVLRAVPGYTLATDMTTARLMVLSLPAGAMVANARSSDPAILAVSKVTVAGGVTTIALLPASRGRARISVVFSDGTEAVAHYMVLPPFPAQVAAVGKHWSEVSWLPRDFPDPFGRGASVMPWDAEDSMHRLNDARAYDCGLSDDAGGGNNLGFATKVGFAPTLSEVERLDEYIVSTLYGIKNDTNTAKWPYKSLQYPEPNNGIRMTMFYYNQTHFDWNYSEQPKCDPPLGNDTSELDNWCMMEPYANATYRGFNYPHQIASYYAMYRVARYHDTITTRANWQWYLERAVNTSLRLGGSKVGYMDGTVYGNFDAEVREVLRSALEEATADPASSFVTLAGDLLKIETWRASYWKTAINPYGSEFAFDTTGMEEVVVWLLYFGFDVAALHTVNVVQSYMRSIPNWAYMGGADATDIGNGGKWFSTADTGFSPMIKMHYRAGLNQIPLAEYFRMHPDEFGLLEIIVGALSGQLANIAEDGAMSMAYHAHPYIQQFDANSGDYGLGFFGISLEATSYFVIHQKLGALCYLCDLSSKTDNGAAAAGGFRGTIVPRDSYRQRIYVEPLGLYVQADVGVFDAVEVDLAAKKIVITFAVAAKTPAGRQTFSKFRLRVDQVSRDGLRPGQNFTLVEPATAQLVRDAYEFPASGGKAATATIGWSL